MEYTKEQLWRMKHHAPELYEALKIASELLKVGVRADDRPVPLIILEALAKVRGE